MIPAYHNFSSLVHDLQTGLKNGALTLPSKEATQSPLEKQILLLVEHYRLALDRRLVEIKVGASIALFTLAALYGFSKFSNRYTWLIAMVGAALLFVVDTFITKELDSLERVSQPTEPKEPATHNPLWIISKYIGDSPFILTLVALLLFSRIPHLSTLTDFGLLKLLGVIAILWLLAAAILASKSLFRPTLISSEKVAIINDITNITHSVEIRTHVREVFPPREVPKPLFPDKPKTKR